MWPRSVSTPQTLQYFIHSLSPRLHGPPARLLLLWILCCVVSALTVDAVFGVAVCAPLCEACSNDIHQTTSALHNIKAIVSEPAHSKVVFKL